MNCRFTRLTNACSKKTG